MKNSKWLQRLESNQLFLGYEPSEIPFLYSAIYKSTCYLVGVSTEVSSCRLKVLYNLRLPGADGETRTHTLSLARDFWR